MDVRQAVEYVSERFQYTSDPSLYDYWMVMGEKNGKMCGDCDDFAFTVLWLICDRNIFKFILNVFILHRYRIYFSKTYSGTSHAVGYAKGLYFDNWTKQALSKEVFLYKTRHKIYFPFPSFGFIYFVVAGLILKFIRER